MDFAVCEEILEPTPCRYWGMTVVKFGGSPKLYVDFQLHRGLFGDLSPRIQGSTVCGSINVKYLE